jgi:hypothetical protein
MLAEVAVKTAAWYLRESNRRSEAVDPMGYSKRALLDLPVAVMERLILERYRALRDDASAEVSFTRAVAGERSDGTPRYVYAPSLLDQVLGHAATRILTMPLTVLLDVPQFALCLVPACSWLNKNPLNTSEVQRQVVLRLPLMFPVSRSWASAPLTLIRDALRRKKCVASLDVQNAFPSISVKRVLKEIADLNLISEGEWTVLERLVRHPENGTGLVLGSSAAPILANYYLGKIDKRCLGLGMSIIRYADNIALIADTERELEAAIAATSKIAAEMDLALRLIDAGTDAIEFCKRSVTKEQVFLSNNRATELYKKIVSRKESKSTKECIASIGRELALLNESEHLLDVSKLLSKPAVTGRQRTQLLIEVFEQIVPPNFLAHLDEYSDPISRSTKTDSIPRSVPSLQRQGPLRDQQRQERPSRRASTVAAPASSHAVGSYGEGGLGAEPSSPKTTWVQLHVPAAKVFGAKMRRLRRRATHLQIVFTDADTQHNMIGYVLRWGHKSMSLKGRLAVVVPPRHVGLFQAALSPLTQDLLKEERAPRPHPHGIEYLFRRRPRRSGVRGRA